METESRPKGLHDSEPPAVCFDYRRGAKASLLKTYCECNKEKAYVSVKKMKAGHSVTINGIKYTVPLLSLSSPHAAEPVLLWPWVDGRRKDKEKCVASKDMNVS